MLTPLNSGNPKLAVYVAATLSILFGVGFAYAELRASAYTKSLEVMVVPFIVACALWWFVLDSKFPSPTASRRLIEWSVVFPYICMVIYFWRSIAPGNRVRIMLGFLGFFAAAFVIMVASAGITGAALNFQAP